MRYYLIELYRTQTGDHPVYASSEGRRAPTLKARFAAKFTSDVAANRHADLCRCKNYQTPKVVVVDDGIVEDPEKQLEDAVVKRWTGE